MKNWNKSIAVAIIAASITAASGGIASAQVTSGEDLDVTSAIAVPAEGGEWDYGVGGGDVWSNYYHHDKTHKSSVRNGFGKFVESAWLTAGYTTYARTGWSPSGGNQSFYNTQ
ncbi:lactococcin 972 family bacteriocin [Rhodococcus erythropolis]|uniref:lactococcin 972 family bacteriocin n=1 Tax=Rhodococcus erythropolis TaxID=1833 RepID=UPI002948D67B|nr:lactococcin 972 family bacteriocin [Rhodococcus erythropolis]MDV6278104.1 lactococcin 972 family bacteriocin [Rhodococcus erythropolis]